MQMGSNAGHLGNLFLEQCDQHYYSSETVESSCIDIFGKIIYIYTIWIIKLGKLTLNLCR